jgi:HPt (histidine-containing phosphotransfer) domain-containing protein
MEAAETLSQSLWSLRDKLDQLVYTLNAQQLFLASGRVKFIEQAAMEVSRAAEAVGEMDSIVQQSARSLHAVVGAAPGSSLTELSNLCPEPWRGVLADHRLELARLRSDVEQMVRLNKEATRRVQGSGPSAYSARGEGVNLNANRPRLNTAG